MRSARTSHSRRISRRFATQLVTVCALGMALMASTTPPTASMLPQGTDPAIYTDPDFEFSFSYPADWDIRAGGLIDPAQGVWEVTAVGPSDYRLMVVQARLNVGTNDVEQWAESLLAHSGLDAMFVAASVGGMSGVQTRADFGSRSTIKTYLIAEDVGYVLSLYEHPGMDAEQVGPLDVSRHAQNLAAYDALLAGFAAGNSTPDWEPPRIPQVEAAAVADQFINPMAGVSNTYNMLDYAASVYFSNSNCYGGAQTLRHAAEDWYGDPGEDVKAVANGQVAWTITDNWYPGHNIIIEHTLPNDNKIYSHYGHLDNVDVSAGQVVAMGDVIGDLVSWPGDVSNTHVHWEMRDMFDASVLCQVTTIHYGGPGYTPLHPDNYGFTKPSTFGPGDGTLTYQSHVLNDNNYLDSVGNDDGVAQCGETIEMWVWLRNNGGSTLTGINAAISENSPYIDLPYNTTSGYDDIPAGGSVDNNNDYDFTVAADTPNGHVVTFDLSITAANGGPWSESFDVTIHCPGNVLPNTSFEEGDENPDPWLLVTKGTNLPGTTATWDCTGANAHRGDCAIHLTTTERLRSRAVVRTDVLTEGGSAGETFELSAWIKGMDIYKPGKVQVIAQVFHTDGTDQWFMKTVKEVEGDFDWMQFSKVFTTEKDYTKVRVYIRIWKIDGGEIWADDASLTATALTCIWYRYW